MMKLVEQYIIKPNSPAFASVDQAAFAAKNLYNAANYIVRPSFIHGNLYSGYVAMNRRMKLTDEYQSLPRKVSQQVLRVLDKNWQSFFAAIKAWKKQPEKFTGRPKLPKYKDKTKGRYGLTYTIQALSMPALRQGIIKPSGLPVEVRTTVNPKTIQQVRIIPKKTHYVMEVIYIAEPQSAEGLDYDLVAGIDLGLDNLATITSNKPGFIPLLVNGRPLKSINAYYNKSKASLQSRLPKGQFTSKQIERLTDKRNRKVKLYLHTVSRRIIRHLISEGIGTLVIGKNDGWKHEISIGKRNNQNFVSIPHAQLVEILLYKAELVGIQTTITEESYTSKTSFLDGESPIKHDVYAGKRVKRGLFNSADGLLINADVNGAYQIIKKVIPDAFSKGILDVVVHPVRTNLTNSRNVLLCF